MQTNQLISLRILALVSEGKSLREAFDMVLGVGAFNKLASDLYDALNG